jgi:hypothetical protein
LLHFFIAIEVTEIQNHSVEFRIKADVTRHSFESANTGTDKKKTNETNVNLLPTSLKIIFTELFIVGKEKVTESDTKNALFSSCPNYLAGDAQDHFCILIILFIR